jgi:hypothetical protein
MILPMPEVPQVEAVHLSGTHSFSKHPAFGLTLLAGIGVAGDAHSGATVKHRSRVRRDPESPNLRQVHLMHAELFEELKARGFRVYPGELGENITTRGLDLLSLPEGTVLRIGKKALVRITGLRNPCSQLDKFQRGLMNALLERARDNSLIRKAGVMGVVLEGGEVQAGDAIEVRWPAKPHRPLEVV